MKRFFMYVLLASLLGGASLCRAEGIAVIVNRANMVESLSIAQLSRVYKGQQQRWSDGKLIMAVDRQASSAVRQVFYRKVLNSKPSRTFYVSGTPIPFQPMVQRSSLATIRFVANLPEAIGYLYLSELELEGKGKDIKVIMVIGVEDNHVQPGKDMKLDKGRVTKGVER